MTTVLMVLVLVVVSVAAAELVRRQIDRMVGQPVRSRPARTVGATSMTSVVPASAEA
jgi:hypothetical protein